MNRLHWCLLLAAIPIVIAAQFVLRYQEVRTLRYVDRADGSGAALLEVSSGVNASDSIEVIAWDADLGNRRTLSWQPALTAKKGLLIAADTHGRFIMVSRGSGVSCLDGKSGEEIWFSGQELALRDATRLEFMNDDQHLLVIRQAGEDGGSAATILNTESGESVAGIEGRNVARFLARGNRFAIQHGRESERFGQWDLFALESDKVRLIESTDFAPAEMLPVEKNVELDVSTTTTYYWDTPYSQRFVSGQDAGLHRRVHAKHAATVEVLPANQFRPELLRSADSEITNTIRVGKLGLGESIFLLSIVAVAVAIWVMVLVLEGASSGWKHRLLMDAVAITVLFIVLFVPLTQGGGQAEADASALQRISFQRTSVTAFFDGPVVAFFAALMMVISIAGLLTRVSAFYLWGGFILACALPVLLPPIAIIFFLVFRGFRLTRSTQAEQLDVSERLRLSVSEPEQNAPKKSKFRFGIGEVMLITTGVALFIAIGQVSFYLIFWGFLLAGVLALSVLLMGESIQATTLFVCAFAVSIFGTGHRLWDLSGTSVFVFALPMLFALAAVHHYRIAKPAVAAAG